MHDETFVQGETIQVDAEFRIAGAFWDPGCVALEVQAPDEVAPTYYDGIEVKRRSAGRFTVYLKVDVVGEYSYRWFAGTPPTPRTHGKFTIVADPDRPDPSFTFPDVSGI
jgi:hypothetical protein